eukprot:TRINITY_DN66617_c0_g1_i2.p5 TRINITY_DN66617_c0_g1~~TRINITY_DN66617_c0_g1_i2.p5  ORF type:complete len:103 (-),score=23.41 TRINITY_DN66617_c0_g1_i2:614-922(-)
MAATAFNHYTTCACLLFVVVGLKARHNNTKYDACSSNLQKFDNKHSAKWNNIRDSHNCWVYQAGLWLIIVCNYTPQCNKEGDHWLKQLQYRDPTGEHMHCRG